MKKFYPSIFRLFTFVILLNLFGAFTTQLYAQITWNSSDLDLNGLTSFGANEGITAMEFGPDGRLYVVQYSTAGGDTSGYIKILTIQKNGPSDYQVTDVEELTDLTAIQDYNDDGSLNATLGREATGIEVVGTAANPVFYVASSDIRVGAGPTGGDSNLDTNSGIITRFSWNGSSWDVVDIVRGLPRSEENHASNGMEFVTINGNDYLLLAQGGHTNGGAPSNNFAYICEYALSGAVLSIDLTAIEQLPILNDNGRNYIYDLPTLDDPTRANENGIEDPEAPGYNGIDVNDPFGGNDGLNQAILVLGGPVQIYSPGYRNAYDLVVTADGKLYATDNGPNGGWGGLPDNEGGGSATNNYDPAEPGSSSPAPDGEFINNEDHLHLITGNIQTYTAGSYYGGHPNPTRANPTGAGLYTLDGAGPGVFRTLTYDPVSPGAGETSDASIALPANWNTVVPFANAVEGDYRGPEVNNPEGPNDDLMTIWGTNTNPIIEYTASNFGGVLTGNLLAGASNGAVRRVELNPDGTLDQLTQNFITGSNGYILGMTTQGDAGAFPGTIWTGAINGILKIFEPGDAVNCLNPGDAGYDPLEDYDSDGYTNQDEIDNGTDHCNGGSQPSDFDVLVGAPLISDLNDPDDDNDGISDATDPFQLGDPLSGGSDAFTIPIQNDLFNFQQGLGGIFGLGMTGLMNNGDTGANWLDWLDVPGQGPNPDDVLGGAPGLMTSHMTSGTANGATNTQDKGYQYGVQTSTATGPFTVIGQLQGFSGALELYGNTAAVGGELGLFIGDGTQSNFIKFVITTAGLTALQEINDVPQTPINVPISVPNRPAVDLTLYFGVDPSNGQVDLEYSIDGAARQSAGTITAQGSILTAIQQAGTDLAVGFTGTSNTVGVELAGTWDYLFVLGEDPFIVQQIPDIDQFINEPDDTFDLNNFFDDDGGQANLTYTVENNTNPSIGASILNNILTLSYPGAPAISNITIRATDVDMNFAEQTFTVNVTDSPIVLYRVNSGGPTISAIDGGIDWEQDTQANNSQYLSQAGSNSAFSFGMTGYTPEVNLTTTPTAIFDTERGDITPGAPNMTYSFPVALPGNYEVRLYIGNGFPGTSQPGERIFDVAIEGVTYPLLNDLDLSGTYGHQTGTVISHIMNVGDGNIDITFIHGAIENPIINGIEILDAPDSATPIYVSPIAEQFSINGEQLDGSLVVQAFGGDGNLNYSISGQPLGISIEPTNGQIMGTIDQNASDSSPYSVTVTVDDNDGLTSDAVDVNFVWNVVNPFNFRINAGGDEFEATDDGQNWAFNNGNGFYSDNLFTVNEGFSINASLTFDQKDPSVPAYIDQATFNAIFSRERYDEPSGAEMEYTIPLNNGDYMVHLYQGNSFEPANQIGDRIYDISIEGVVVQDNLDLIAEFGHLVAGMLAFPVNLTDGELNIQFLHDVAENPIISAIEIWEVDTSNPTLTLNSINNQLNDVSDAVSFSASGSGGDPGQNITYYMTGQPVGIGINSSNGLISGTIGAGAATGGPLGDGVHSVTVTVTKPGSAPASQSFSWSINSNITWNNKNEDLGYTGRHENSFVQAGDKFYLMGGRESPTTIDIYDYTSNTWQNLTNAMPSGLEFNHFQATEYQGLIWVIGAFQDNNFPNEAPAEFVWAFDPSTQEWIQGPQIPVARRRGSAGLVMYNDKFYVIAGNNDGHDGGYVAQFDEYDPISGTWTPLTDAPRARDHFAAVVIGDELYVSSGRLSGGPGGTFAPTIPEVDVYNFTSGTWSTLPAGQNIPTPRAGASAVNFNNRLVVIGGETESAGPALATTEEYNPAAQNWQTLPDMNSPRHGTQAIVSGSGIYILSGSPSQGSGNQKNMEFYGVDAPEGDPSDASTLSGPFGVQIADGDTESFDLDITDGNIGIFVTSMTLSGPNAGDFVITAGELTDQLLLPNSTHNISVQLTGTGAGRSATLTVNYGTSSTLDILLTNDNVPPAVTNPGDQFNNEGDPVSLQIEASDASTNLAYSATGLPPNLMIDANTGLISGTISDGSGDTFDEENGLVVIEMESLTFDTNWILESTQSGFTGTGYLNNQTDSFGLPGIGTITASVNITNPGLYRFQWHNRIGIIDPMNPSTEHNDAWLRFPDASDFFSAEDTAGTQDIKYPKGSGKTPVVNGAGSDGWFKVYTNNLGWTWATQTSDNELQYVFVQFDNPGIYTMEISSRSAGHLIDRATLHRVSDNYTEGQLFSAPESQNSGGTGAADNSPYSVEVTVTDDGVPPLDSSVQFTWFVGDQTNTPPVALAEATPVEGDAPLLVTFTGSNSTDDVGIVSYFWDFKDGNTSTLADPTNTFMDSGTYIVELTVTDGGGLTDTDTITITVNNPAGNEPPVAVAEATPTSGEVPLEVFFTGSNSTDDVAVVSYFWDFQDGTTSDLADTEHSFTMPGTYVVELTVTDAEGLTDTDTVTITVTEPGGNQPPVAIPEATPLVGDAPLEVNFTGSNSTDDVGIVSYFWDFLDGTTSNEADPVHTFTASGIYHVQLTVTDGGGLTDTDSVAITVSDPNMNQPPFAIAVANPLFGESPLEVTFIGSNSSDDEGIVSYSWDFADGGTSNEADPVYTFVADGTYVVSLTVEDAEGLTDTATVTIVVGESDNLPPVAVIGANPLIGSVPLEVEFIGRNSTDDFEIVSYSWDFGDGTTSTLTDPTHTYTDPGEYTVELIVEDAEGLTGTATVVITVLEAGDGVMAIVQENPTKMGTGKIQLINQPSDVVLLKLFLHDYSGRFIGEYDAQQVFVSDPENGDHYAIPVAQLRDGLYFVSLEMNKGDMQVLKMFVVN